MRDMMRRWPNATIAYNPHTNFVIARMRFATQFGILSVGRMKLGLFTTRWIAMANLYRDASATQERHSVMARGLSNFPGNCVECASLLGHYEALTFEQAQAHNSLDIAKFLCDRASTTKLTISAYAVTKRRDSARNALMQHRAAVHDLSAAA
jgi:hypothetical protein